MQPRPTWDRLEVPFSFDALLSGYEDLHLPVSDQFTMWRKMTPDEIFLTEHVVDIHRIEADFRDAFERNQASSSQTYGVNKYFSSQSPVQKRLCIYILFLLVFVRSFRQLSRKLSSSGVEM